MPQPLPELTPPIVPATRVRACVDGAALRHNVRLLQRLAPTAQVMPVVKADGYGHGAQRVTRALQDLVPSFAVAAISEAVALREAGVQAPLCVLSGPQDPADWDLCARWALDVVIHAPWQWAQLLQRPQRPRFWIKLDTGMGRLGFLPDQVPPVAAELSGLPRADCLGVMTHLACADTPGHPQTQVQLDVFAALCAEHFPERTPSIANSAAIAAWPQTRIGVLRPGLLTYGVNPLAIDALSGPLSDLRPALRLEARVIALKQLPAGHGVGYGADWIAPAPTQIAIVAAGYADGILRCMGSTGFALTAPQGMALPLRGRVSMDMLAVEVPAGCALAPGDWIGIWGAGAMPVEQAAVYARTVPYELLTALGERVRHVDQNAI